MRSPMSGADRRVAFWTQKADWPDAPHGYVFLGDVVGMVGQAVFGEQWTGLEPATELTTPLPEELLASVPTAELQRGCRLLYEYDEAYRSRCPAYAQFLDAWPMPIQDDWVRAAILANQLAEQRRMEFGRFIEVATRLQQAFRSALIHTATRKVAGGEMCPQSQWFWNTESFWGRFQMCRVHLSDPFNAAAAIEGDSYIFVDRRTLTVAMHAPEEAATASSALETAQQEYLSPYVRCMIDATRGMKITADDNRKKDEIIDALPKYWRGPGEPSGEDVDRMATLIRGPNHKRGRGKNKPTE